MGVEVDGKSIEMEHLPSPKVIVYPARSSSFIDIKDSRTVGV